MRACILSIGTELMRGEILDRNAAYIATELTALGFEVVRVVAYPDTLAELAAGVSDALALAPLMVCTGGLGPTQDDVTRQAIAQSLGEDIIIDPVQHEIIVARFASMHRAMPASNVRQAGLIPSAEPIPNENGTAPGWYVRSGSRIVVALPGPPREMQPMWEEWVRPHLAALLPGQLATSSVMTFGIGESAIEERIADVISWKPEVTVATYAKDAGVLVHISARANDDRTAEAAVREADLRVRNILGTAVFGTGGDTLSSVVGSRLHERRETVAVMESASGGELASAITNIAGSSEYFTGGVVAYTRAAKATNGVDPTVMDSFGLISAETAYSMSSAVRRLLGSTYGVAITGIAGTEQVEGKSPGTCFVSVAGDLGHTELEIHRPGTRESAKRFFAQSALNLLRHTIRDLESVRQ